jgi:hypothetical protein
MSGLGRLPTVMEFERCGGTHYCAAQPPTNRSISFARLSTTVEHKPGQTRLPHHIDLQEESNNHNN